MGNAFGQQINPQPPTSLFNTAYGPGGSTQQQTFLNNLATFTMGSPAGGMGPFAGVQGYPGQLSPDINQTILPSVYNNWQPWDGGTQYIANMMSQPGFGNMPSQFQGPMNNVMNYGGVGGYPTDLMHGMAQFGGTGGPGNQAMSNMLQFGVPSAAGNPMVDIMKTGGTGGWGDSMKAIAGGSMSSGPASYLAPFLSAKPYSPTWASSGGKS